ncbi:phage integrase [Aeromonas hydrophila]|uniref:phage integrase n=1 Tax=Aeromonas hydrophila TaxID=644 RepID=UPI001F60BFD6|nr:tyrosine-type recombinase/integrase [Aeromonas hydrophila]UNU29102.1 tyrosine-type recombinase/integrase [Aeromonas hydrophila]
MAVRKSESGKWLIEVYPLGRPSKENPKAPRIRKLFATKGEALAFERFVLDPDKGKPWLEGQEEPTDGRRLSDLVELWFGRHGQSLRDGEARKSKLLTICDALGDPLAEDFTARDFAAYREARLSGEITDRRAVNQEKLGVTPNTVNREHAYLRAVFNELKRLGEWQRENPLDGLRAYKVAEAELAFLYPDELKRLLAACKESPNPDLLLVVKLCLATGARWSEVEELTQSQVSPNRVTFTRTKSKKSRSVPISPELYAQLPRKRGRLFGDCYRAFEMAAERIGLELPPGQSTHVLRHTFASHFMMNGGNILVLQKILGHSTITMTMRYAHFAPDHLEEAVRLNPLVVCGVN